MEREELKLPLDGQENPRPDTDVAGSAALEQPNNEESSPLGVQYGVETKFAIDEPNAPIDGDSFDEIESEPADDDIQEPDSAVETHDAAAAFPIAAGVQPRKKSYRKLFFAVLFTAFIADQITKAIAVFYLGYLQKDYTLLSFFGDYFTRVREFPWRIGTEIYKPPVDVFGDVLQWRLTTNTGAAFSMFKGNPETLAVVSAVLITVLYLLYRRWGRGSVLLSVAFGMQIGGALGNFADRARLGEVVDFIATRVPGIENGQPALVDFPIFNVADACAVVGTMIIGLVLIVKDIAYTKAHRRAIFESNVHKKLLAEFQNRIHPIAHSEYSAQVEFLPPTAQPEAPETAEMDDSISNPSGHDESVGDIIEPFSDEWPEVGDE